MIVCVRMYVCIYVWLFVCMFVSAQWLGECNEIDDDDDGDEIDDEIDEIDDHSDDGDEIDGGECNEIDDDDHPPAYVFESRLFSELNPQRSTCSFCSTY